MKRHPTTPPKPQSLNACPRYLSARGRKGALKSPWSKGPVVNTRKAHATFAANR